MLEGFLETQSVLDGPWEMMIEHFKGKYGDLVEFFMDEGRIESDDVCEKCLLHDIEPMKESNILGEARKKVYDVFCFSI